MLEEPRSAGYMQDASPRAAILRLLQSRPHASIKDLELALGVTATAVREQLSHLLAEGMITSERVRGVVGRPFYVYSLTRKGHEVFPKEYGELARLMLHETLALFGPEGLEALLDGVGRRLADSYAGQVQGEELKDRLYALASLLGRKGFGAGAAPSETGDGFVLHEATCPFYAIVQERPEICGMEQRMMSRLLDADVSLSACVLEGHTGCQFKVMPRATASGGTGAAAP